MKVNICGYEVSLTAKHPWMQKADKTSTMEFLNYLSIVLDEAANSYNIDGHEHNAKTCELYSNQLYDFNREHGLYSK